MKTLWTRRADGRWAIHDAKGITLKPKAGFEPDYFVFNSDMELMTSSPPKNLSDLFASFGSTDFLMKQSIVPVVAWVHRAPSIRCIGTAFVVSCTGYVITASHVLLDPQESGYGKVVGRNGNIETVDGMIMGVLMPVNPASGIKGFKILPFEQAWYWGKWTESPLIHQPEKLDSLTDIAVCKLPEQQDGSAYQPLNLSLNPFTKGETAYAIGYAEMKDIPVEYIDDQPRIADFKWEMYVSIGEVVEIFPQNHFSKSIPAPGPSFDFRARIPGKMSGGPNFGARGSVVRGVVSRSFSGEKHAFGNMVGPTLTLPFTDGRSLKSIMDAGNDGIPMVQGQGL
jgi:hypothetical protein